MQIRPFETTKLTRTPLLPFGARWIHDDEGGICKFQLGGLKGSRTLCTRRGHGGAEEKCVTNIFLEEGIDFKAHTKKKTRKMHTVSE